MKATIYLLHFDKSYFHARHYLGSTRYLEARLEHHRRGTGSRLMAAVSRASIGFIVARTWTGERTLESKLKRRKHNSLLCPLCNSHLNKEDLTDG